MKGLSMKKHAIIPIFIPHLGCPNDCVFCNQRAITARTSAPTTASIRSTILEWLSTLEPEAGSAARPFIEVAFYGGSFTGLDIEEQSQYLAVAREFLDAGRIDGIHLSTRPDYIDRPILDNLKAYGVSTIELGVQSFDDRVLELSNRGHTVSVVYDAVKLIKAYGFRLGIQLMIGLPGDSLESCIYSAREAAGLKPELARLYPTIVLDDTRLLEMYRAGEYKALDREEAIERTLAMYRILDNAGIYIMRVGLKSTDIIGDGGAINGGTYHPAFRQLVEGRLMRDLVETELECVLSSVGEISQVGNAASVGETSQVGIKTPDRHQSKSSRLRIRICSSPAWFSNLIGNCGVNRQYFAGKYPQLDIKYGVDSSLDAKEISVKII